MVELWQCKNALTIEERYEIKKALDLNLSYREIAKYVGRAKTTVWRECSRLGNPANYDPEKAQNHFETLQHLKKTNKKSHSNAHI